MINVYLLLDSCENNAKTKGLSFIFLKIEFLLISVIDYLLLGINFIACDITLRQ